jgi:hypothetical protein
MVEGFANEYTITPTRFVNGLTWGLILMFLLMITLIPASIYFIEKHLLATFGMLFLMLGVFIPTLFFSWYYSPTKYSVSEKEVKIYRPRNVIVIPISEIRKVEAKDFKAYKMLRKWGNGGLFSISGKFWTKADGDFWCYAKNNNFVMLHANTKWVVSPDDKDLFITDVMAKIEKPKKLRK